MSDNFWIDEKPTSSGAKVTWATQSSQLSTEVMIRLFPFVMAYMPFAFTLLTTVIFFATVKREDGRVPMTKAALKGSVVRTLKVSLVLPANVGSTYGATV